MASTCVDEKDVAPGVGRFLGEHLAYLKQGFSFSGYERDLLCLNLRDGRFLDVSGASGADSITDGRAAVFVDYDGDGDLDIFLRAMHGPAHLLFRNDAGHCRAWVRVAVEGRASGRDAFGTVVRLKTSQGVLTKVKSGGCGFLAQHDPRLLFGLGGDERAEWLEVTWPGGRVERLPGPRAGREIRLVEPE